jgi:hypothetical protein
MKGKGRNRFKHLNQENDSVVKNNFLCTKCRSTFNFLLRVSGLLPPQNAMPFKILLYKIFLTGTFTLAILGLLGQIIAVYVYWGDIPEIANITSHLIALLLATIACLYFLQSKN